MMNVMLCGAEDITELLPPFKEVAAEFGFNPSNYIDGRIEYHNYGIDRWERNARATVSSSHALVFVINERYGEITWKIELEEAINRGKNFIVLCRDEIYTGYNFFRSQRLEYPSNLDLNKRSLYLILERLENIKLENVNQVTVARFKIFEFKDILKEHLIKLFQHALVQAEKENIRSSFIPILMSSRYNNLLPEYINENNEKMCKDIAFDFFENKEMRKRALEYFKHSKSLTDENIAELCADMEQGVKRKTISLLPELLHSHNDLNVIFENIIESIANDDDVGLIRRAIKTFIKINLELSIRHFKLFFPANDIGTPKRIVASLKEHENDLDNLLLIKPQLTTPLEELLTACVNYSNDKADWKSVANEMLKRYKLKEEITDNPDENEIKPDGTKDNPDKTKDDPDEIKDDTSEKK